MSPRRWSGKKIRYGVPRYVSIAMRLADADHSTAVVKSVNGVVTELDVTMASTFKPSWRTPKEWDERREEEIMRAQDMTREERRTGGCD